MSLHAPFGYVGYVTGMGKTIIDLLERFCGSCHTNDDYEGGCHGCPAGNLIYIAREYILECPEEDKHYALYASDKWQETRKKNGWSEQSPEQKEEWKRLSLLCHPESVALRGLKKELKKIEPKPFFYSQFIWDKERHPDPLIKYREYLKDYEFHEHHVFADYRITGEVEKHVRARLKEDLLRFVIKEEDKEAAEPKVEMEIQVVGD